jgi:hypothetical protein
MALRIIVVLVSVCIACSFGMVPSTRSMYRTVAPRKQWLQLQATQRDPAQPSATSGLNVRNILARSLLAATMAGGAFSLVQDASAASGLQLADADLRAMPIIQGLRDFSAQGLLEGLRDFLRDYTKLPLVAVAVLVCDSYSFGKDADSARAELSLEMVDLRAQLEAAQAGQADAALSLEALQEEGAGQAVELVRMAELAQVKQAELQALGASLQALSQSLDSSADGSAALRDQAEVLQGKLDAMKRDWVPAAKLLELQGDIADLRQGDEALLSALKAFLTTEGYMPQGLANLLLMGTAPKALQEVLDRGAGSRKAAVQKGDAEAVEREAQREAAMGQMAASLEAASTREKAMGAQLEAAQSALQAAEDMVKAAESNVGAQLAAAQSSLQLAEDKVGAQLAAAHSSLQMAENKVGAELVAAQAALLRAEEKASLAEERAADLASKLEEEMKKKTPTPTSASSVSAVSVSTSSGEGEDSKLAAAKV